MTALGLSSCYAERVAQRLLPLACFLIAAIGAPSCSRLDQRLQQHKEQLASLGATAAAIGEAWLAGSVSGAYARTAFEQTLMLVERERAALASSPQMLVDSRGAHLSEAGERLSRLLAAMIRDVDAADPASVRRRIAEIPIMPDAPKHGAGGRSQ